jgi:hypothetical protein
LHQWARKRRETSLQFSVGERIIELIAVVHHLGPEMNHSALSGAFTNHSRETRDRAHGAAFVETLTQAIQSAHVAQFTPLVELSDDGGQCGSTIELFQLLTRGPNALMGLEEKLLAVERRERIHAAQHRPDQGAFAAQIMRRRL